MPESSTPHRNVQWLTSLWSRSLGRSLVPLLLIITVLAGGVAHPSYAASEETRVLPQLQEEAAQQPDQDFRVIVTRIGKDKKADAKLKEHGGRKLKDLGNYDGFVATVKGKDLIEIGKDKSVKYIAYDAPMVRTGGVDASKLGTLYPGAANASGLWSSSGSGSAVTGAGVGVAVLDTGINENLHDWKGADGNTRIRATNRFSSSVETIKDGHGHGTHVAGIIAGNSWHRSDSTLRGKYVGIAPEANIINVKVSDDQGMSYLSDVVNAIDWVIKERQTHNIRVMNLSLVSSVAESAKTNTLAAAVERAWFNGILVVVAAGNAGPNTMQYPPANDPFVITVGAADPMGTVSRADDGMAPWSSYGVTQDGFSKPDLVAPGRHIVSALSSGGATLAKQFPDRLVDSNNYIRMSGTSMAAPVVAGIAALAFQAHPEWTNDQVKWLLMNTATVLGEATPLAGQGASEVDAAKVVRYSGTPQFANQGLTANEQLVGPNGTVVYDSAASWSTASWSTASWSTASWSTASWSTASWSTASWSTSNLSTSTWSTNSFVVNDVE